MNYSKVLWGIRAVLYKCLTNISLPSYIGKPTYINQISKLSFGKKVRIYPGLRAEAYGRHGFILDLMFLLAKISILLRMMSR